MAGGPAGGLAGVWVRNRANGGLGSSITATRSRVYALQPAYQIRSAVSIAGYIIPSFGTGAAHQA